MRANAGTQGTREEEGGKENAGQPSGNDLGALEANGEAGGTHTSPGPSAQDVERFKQTQAGWEGHAAKNDIGGMTNGTTDPAKVIEEGLKVPNGEAAAGGRPGMPRHWSVAQSMTPHLQLM